MRLRIAPYVLATLLAGASPGEAWADASADAATARQAVELGRGGIELYSQGEWAQALEKFDEAEAMYHSPVFLLYAARSLSHLGRLLEARDRYRRLAADELPDSAPPPWRTAQVDARAELAALEAELPRLTVILDPAAEGAEVTVDGASVATGEAIPLDPGPHVVVTTRGAESSETRVELRRGEGERTVTLTMAAGASPPPSPAPLSSVPPSPGPADAAPAEDDASLALVGWVLSGVGAAGLIAGGVIGGVAISESGTSEDAIRDLCNGDLSRCPPGSQPTIEELRTQHHGLADASTGLLIGGGVALAAGIVLLLVDAAGDDNEPASVGYGPGGLSIRF